MFHIQIVLRNRSPQILSKVFSFVESVLTVFPKEFDLNQCVQHASNRGSVIQHLCFFFWQLGAFGSVDFPDHSHLFKEVLSEMVCF